MRLEASTLQSHLRRQNRTLYLLTRFFDRDQRDGIEALFLFIEILNHSVASAGSRTEALTAVEDLETLFRRGLTPPPLYEQTHLDAIIESHPNFGLAWEAWCFLEETFDLSREQAHDFIEGLRFEAEGRRPENLEALLRYVYMSGGVLGAALGRILKVDPSFAQSAVDAASSARLTTLMRNYRRDLELGRNRMPSELHGVLGPTPPSPTRLFKSMADTFFRSFIEALPKVSFKHRILFATALVLHRTNDAAWFTKLDRSVDILLRISAQRAGELITMIFKSTNRFEPVPRSAPLDAKLNAGLALQNQSLRLSRDLVSASTSRSMPPNDHTPDKPSTSR